MNKKLFQTLCTILGIAVASLAHAATITVDTTALDQDANNNGNCSLIEAIYAANLDAKEDGCPAGSGADTIVLTAGATYTATDAINGTTALPLVSTAITIEGNGATIVRAEGAPQFSFFLINAKGDLTINSLTLRNGSGNFQAGGAITLFDGKLHLTDGTMENNQTDGLGGALQISSNGGLSQVTIHHSTFSNNHADGPSHSGGAIYWYSAGTLKIIDSTFTKNSAALHGAAITMGPYNETAKPTVDIAQSIFKEHIAGTAQDVLLFSRALATVSDSTIADNQMTGLVIDGSTGELFLRRSTIAKNTTGPSGLGGGIGVAGGSRAVVVKSSLIGNASGGDGGGIYVHQQNSRLTVEDTTLAKNTAAARGGAIFSLGNEISLIGSTLANNQAQTGGAVFHDGSGTTFSLQNTLMDGNTATANPGCNTPLKSKGHNLLGIGQNCGIEEATGDHFEATAALVGLEALVDSTTPGGTFFPTTGASLAVNGGDSAVCIDDPFTSLALALDQLGNARVGTCDIGAIEAYCGDGFAQSTNGEQCDVGAQNIDTGACTATCQSAICGDSKVQAGVETCDDGNQDNSDGCPSTCQSPKCGDAVVETNLGETCDDANAVNTDSCLNSCALAKCGDGIVQTGAEACDDGNAVNTDACLNTCVAAKCGDGFVQTDVEECDGSSDCSTTCKTVPTPTGATEATAPATTGDTTTTTDTTETTTPAAASSGGGCSLIIR